MSSVLDYITKLSGYDEHSFTWEELFHETRKSESALQNELGRLTRKKQIVNLRAGFYLILSPRYRSFGRIPVELYVEKLFKYLNKPYYVALYSAAALHGAGHQQVQKDYLMTQVPNMRDIKKGANQLSIFSTTRWPSKNLEKKKSAAGYFDVSSPALTAIDLIHHQTKLGGMNRMFSILVELAEVIRAEDTADLLTWYPNVSSIQRLGFILQTVGVAQDVLDLLKDYLSRQNTFPILLRPEKNRKAGRTVAFWKVDANIKLENNL